MSTNNGNDTLWGAHWSLTADGGDSIYGGNGDDVGGGSYGNDYINGGNNNDTLYGDEGNDRLSGESGNDYLRGGWGWGSDNNGNDILDGGSGNDTLVGDNGNDTLLGQDGNDNLNGGLGQDYLAGGLGIDTFDFDFSSDSPSGGAIDTIANFKWSEGDKIDLSTIDANLFLTGNQSFATGQMNYNSSTGIFTADVINGADLQIKMVGLQTGFNITLDVIA